MLNRYMATGTRPRVRAVGVPVGLGVTVLCLNTHLLPSLKKSICLLNQMFIDYKSIVSSFQDETKVSDVHSLLWMSQIHYCSVVLL